MKLKACPPGAIRSVIHSHHFFDPPANQSLAGEPSRPAKPTAWPTRRRFIPYLIFVICIFFWLIAALNLCGQGSRRYPGP